MEPSKETEERKKRERKGNNTTKWGGDWERPLRPTIGERTRELD